MTAILGLQADPLAGSLYATGRYGRAQRRSGDAASVRRRLWALRFLGAVWAAAIVVTLVLVVSWWGWSTAAFTHLPMVGLMLALLHAVRVERRWLARVRAAGRR